MLVDNIIFAPIAQLVEQIPLKDKVVGSIPTGRTKTHFVNFLCGFLDKVRTFFAENPEVS